MSAAGWPNLRLLYTFRNRQRLSGKFSSCTGRFSACGSLQPIRAVIVRNNSEGFSFVPHNDCCTANSADEQVETKRTSGSHLPFSRSFSSTSAGDVIAMCFETNLKCVIDECKSIRQNTICRNDILPNRLYNSEKFSEFRQIWKRHEWRWLHGSGNQPGEIVSNEWACLYHIKPRYVPLPYSAWKFFLNN